MFKTHSYKNTVPRNIIVTIVACCLIVSCFFNCNSAHAQGDVNIRGLIDLVAQGEDQLLYLNSTNFQDSNFDALRARIFVEGGNERTQFFLQTLFSQESFSSVRLYGAYLLHQPFESRDIYLEAGLIPVHDGIWAHQTYSDKNPLIAIPLAYYWKSSLPVRQMPTDMDHLLSQRGQGQSNPVYADSLGVRGRFYHSAPMLYDNCWNYGAYSLGTLNNIEYAVGVTVGAPTDPVSSSDSNEDLSLHAKLGYAVTPGLKFYVSGASGAYLSRDVIPYLPNGKTINDYMQSLLIGSVDWQWNYINVTGEFFINHFDTPLRAEGLSSQSYYVQSTYKFRPGWYIAGRYDELRYEEVSSGGSNVSWDDNIRRYELGLGYHVSRGFLTKFVVQQTDVGSGWNRESVIPALQLSYSF